MDLLSLFNTTLESTRFDRMVGFMQIWVFNLTRIGSAVQKMLFNYNMISGSIGL